MPKHDEYKEIARAVLAHTAGVLALAERWLRRADQLGRVDGFNQDEAECQGYEGSVVLRGLLASECDAFEALEFADGLLDACPRLVEYFREECRSIDRV